MYVAEPIITSYFPQNAILPLSLLPSSCLALTDQHRLIPCFAEESPRDLSPVAKTKNCHLCSPFHLGLPFSPSLFQEILLALSNKRLTVKRIHYTLCGKNQYNLNTNRKVTSRLPSTHFRLLQRTRQKVAFSPNSSLVLVLAARLACCPAAPFISLLCHHTRLICPVQSFSALCWGLS